MAQDIKNQIQAFKEGFHELIPSSLINIFDSHEFELLISGLPNVDCKKFLFKFFNFNPL